MSASQQNTFNRVDTRRTSVARVMRSDIDMSWQMQNAAYRRHCETHEANLRDYSKTCTCRRTHKMLLDALLSEAVHYQKEVHGDAFPPAFLKIVLANVEGSFARNTEDPYITVLSDMSKFHLFDPAAPAKCQQMLDAKRNGKK